MSDLDGVRIDISDIRATGYCVSGARRWFALHGIDFADFLKHGIPAQELIDRGDELAVRVVEHKQRQTDGR